MCSIRNSSHSFFGLFALTFAFCLSSCSSTPRNELPHIPGQAVYRDAASGLEIYDDLSNDPFPSDWHSDDIAIEATPIDQADVRRSIKAIRSALSKYPASFIHANLRCIYLLGSLRFGGITAGSTSSSDRVYISIITNESGFTQQYVEGAFHHELGHLVQNKYVPDWPTKAWEASNPPGFHYVDGSGVKAIQSGHDSISATDEWSSKGFASEYGASDAYEDFATIAADLFSGDRSFWTRVDRYSALRAKVSVAERFYAKLDPHFKDSYFRKLPSDEN